MKGEPRAIHSLSFWLYAASWAWVNSSRKAILAPFKYSEPASDTRWRVREGVAMGLQRLGDTDIKGLLSEMERWSQGNFLEMRAAAASLCEPRLLKQTEHAREVLLILDRITTSISGAKNRNTDAFKALRKSVGYCRSVAVAANPDAGMSIWNSGFRLETRTYAGL
jgi:hypothetical protein